MDHRRHMSRGVVAVAVSVLTSAAQGITIYVDDDGGVAGDGLTWGTCCRFLQEALANAAGDPSITEIHVAQGTYTPDRDEANPGGSGDRHATFQLLNGVSLMGGFAGLGTPDPDARDIALYETILSGDLLGDDGPGFANNDENAHTVVAGNETDGTAVLDGVTVTAGNADGPPQDDDAHKGGGMFTWNGTPTVISCTFDANYAEGGGGGMYNFNHSDLTVTNCMFAGNSAGSSGGGMYNRHYSDPAVTNCTFEGNTADGFDGGGMHNFDNSNPVVASGSFTSNLAGRNGGGMQNFSICSPTVTNCTFTENSADTGGGMHNEVTCIPTVTDSDFCGNRRTSDGSPDHITGAVILQGVNISPVCPIPVCRADCDGDGMVNVVDFLDVIALWGPCP